MNIYSDSSHMVLKYFKNTEAYIHNLLIMTSDFSIQDSLWDPAFPYHSSISDNLIIIADSFNLELSFTSNPILTMSMIQTQSLILCSFIVGQANSTTTLSPLFDVYVSMRQGSALSPILSALYLLSFF